MDRLLEDSNSKLEKVPELIGTLESGGAAGSRQAECQQKPSLPGLRSGKGDHEGQGRAETPLGSSFSPSSPALGSTAGHRRCDGGMAAWLITPRSRSHHPHPTTE